MILIPRVTRRMIRVSWVTMVTLVNRVTKATRVTRLSKGLIISRVQRDNHAHCAMRI